MAGFKLWPQHSGRYSVIFLRNDLVSKWESWDLSCLSFTDGTRLSASHSTACVCTEGVGVYLHTFGARWPKTSVLRVVSNTPFVCPPPLPTLTLVSGSDLWHCRLNKKIKCSSKAKVIKTSTVSTKKAFSPSFKTRKLSLVDPSHPLHPSAVNMEEHLVE